MIMRLDSFDIWTIKEERKLRKYLSFTIGTRRMWRRLTQLSFASEKLFARKVNARSLSNFHPLAAVSFSTKLENFNSFFIQHKDTPDNTESTLFDFTPENFKRVISLVTKAFLV